MEDDHLITLSVGGERFSGVWRVERNRLVVASAYGDIRTTLREPSADPESMARRLLRELVNDWLEGPELFAH